MGILADIYSGSNTLKRRLNALIKDPVGTINTGVIRAREDNNKLLNLFANAYPMAGDKTVLNSPQQIAQFQGEAADKAGEMGLAGATVWHGSPHKFDKFDSSKIGTGEGAQAYGHGLYLAEAPEVAKGYQAAVKDSGKISNINAELSRLAKIMSADEISYGKYKSDVGRNAQKQYYDLMDSRGSVVADPGQLYKVDLPDEHIAKMLDWDKPLSEQAPEVQKALASNPNYKKYWLPHTEARARAGENPAGSDLHRYLSDDYGPDEVADLLKSQGIPGIRYLDGGSRSGGAGTSNFVVFPGNEGLLSILERNGQPMNHLQKFLK